MKILFLVFALATEFLLVKTILQYEIRLTKVSDKVGGNAVPSNREGLSETSSYYYSRYKYLA